MDQLERILLVLVILDAVFVYLLLAFQQGEGRIKKRKKLQLHTKRDYTTKK